MPIGAEFRDEERTIIIRLVGKIEASELETFNRQTVVPFLLKNAPHTAHLIWDVYEHKSDFSKFVQFLTLAKERRNDSNAPMNFQQHFVGSNSWILTFRTWAQRNYGEDTSSFTNIADALTYIRSN